MTDIDKKLDLDLTPTTPTSPRQPAHKRTKKDASPCADDEESTYEQDLLNKMGWIIHYGIGKKENG